MNLPGTIISITKLNARVHSVKKLSCDCGATKDNCELFCKRVRTHRTSWHYICAWHHQVVVGEWAQCDSQSKIGRRATESEWATQPESGALPQRDLAQNFYKTFVYACTRGDRTFKRTHTFTGGGKRFWLRALLMKWKFFGAPIIFGSHPRIIVVNEQSASEPARRKVRSHLGTPRPLYTAHFAICTLTKDLSCRTF